MSSRNHPATTSMRSGILLAGDRLTRDTSQHCNLMGFKSALIPKLMEADLPTATLLSSRMMHRLLSTRPAMPVMDRSHRSTRCVPAAVPTARSASGKRLQPPTPLAMSTVPSMKSSSRSPEPGCRQLPSERRASRLSPTPSVSMPGRNRDGTTVR